MNMIKKWWVLTAVSVALSLVAIDMTVLYTALPSLTHSLGANTTEKLWIVNIYPLVVSGLLLGAGTLGDRIGHKRLFVYGLIIFGFSSLIAAYSYSPEMLVVFRALLGVGAAIMMPATLSIIALTFEDEDEKSFAIGIWTAVASGGAAIGPLIGGLLLEYFWWGSVFLINVPLVIVTLILSWLFVPTARTDSSHPWDLIGSLQIMVVLISFAYAIKEFAKQDPSYIGILVTFTLTIGFLALFIRRQKRSVHPLIDFNLFKSPAFSSAVISGLVASACLMGINLVLSQRLQLVLSLTPLQAGLYFLPFSLGAIVASPVSGWVLPRLGSERFLITSLLVYAFAILALMASFSMPLPVQVVCFFVLGTCIGATMTAASSTIMQAVPPNRAGMAASVEEVSYELGGGLGIAIMGSIMSVIYSYFIEIPVNSPIYDAAKDGIDGALTAAKGMAPDAGQALVSLAKSAFDDAVFSVMGAASLLLLIIAVLVWFNFRRSSLSDTSHAAIHRQ
ncbi:MFS transporter [Photorhabdus bodei]|uniref:MFS transporter n=1 Tax=Photorhabdus bodei TaxID=2029681 RepID=A0A329XEZ1_9GAMM|nr:MFS transporter [Photorhabdus bodei]NDK97541.1 MFS transporter [Photorhabdus bodei]NDL01789.1 MFS transporter [Photorhabdus bodei]NDL06780.1 MFS transporter [Photorhabdus bodei]RAX13678.1 MFS transporter [Photorhabdus bodei]